MTADRERLILKWGTVKGWDNLSEKSIEALHKWADGGISMSAAAQRDTPGQKAALCHAIDVISKNGGMIWNDWDGREMTAEAAKSYIMGYGS